MPVPTPRPSLSLVPPLPVHPQDNLKKNVGEEREAGDGRQRKSQAQVAKVMSIAKKSRSSVGILRIALNA